MSIELIIIGHELLNGDLADTNTQRFGRRLRELGLRIRQSQCVPDDMDAIVAAFGLASMRADIVLVSGGLGPTNDDLTLEAAARFAGVTLVEHTPTLEGLKARYAARGVPFTSNNARQAMVPDGSEVFDNPAGTAPHVQFQVHTTRFFFFPGVPRELELLVERHLVPWFMANGLARAYDSRVFKTFGQTESRVAMELAAVEAAADSDTHIAYRAHFPEIHVSVHAYHADAAARAAALDAAEAGVLEALGSLVFARAATTSMAEVVGNLLVQRNHTVAVAESCTGGLLGGALTAVSGSSAWFHEGFITYSNAAKTRLVGVPADLIAAHGAVSPEVAVAMAEGARAAAQSDWALAVTGIAGPTGGSDEKPVGTVHFALAGPHGTIHVHRRFPFDRERNRVVAVQTALDILRKALLES